VLIVVLVVFVGAYAGGSIINRIPTPSEEQAARSQQMLQDIHNKVASDAEAQYRIVLRNGTRIDICVHAGLVAAAYLQAQNEAKYQQWKSTESSDCKLAGVPR
jgi:hypothetical protein